MADAGAEVIKIERAEGDFARRYDQLAAGESSYFAWLNRGKRSIALDVKDRTDRALLDRMIADADIFVSNLAPGAVGKLSLDAATLRSRDPRLIVVEIVGFGDGPYGQRKAYDLLIQAETGLAYVTGSPDAPGRVGVSMVDIATGQTAYQAALEALIWREKTGEGATIQISLFDVTAEWMSVPFLQAQGGRPPERIGLAHPSVAPYGVFQLADGELLLSVQNDREWKKFCAKILTNPELAGDPRFHNNSLRVANRSELDALVAAALAPMTVEIGTDALTEAGIAYGIMNDLDGLAAHPHLRRIDVELPSSTLTTIAPPYRLHQLPYGRVPQINADGPAIRAEYSL